MKVSAKFLAATLVTVGLMISSCDKKEDDTQQPDPTATNELKASIDGQPWTGSIGSVATSGGTKQLNANASDGSSFQVFFPEDTTGSFDLATSNSITISYSTGSVFWSDNFAGTFILTENTANRVSGTFSTEVASAFNSDTLSITGGSFEWVFK